MDLDNSKDLIKELLFKKLEADDSHNLFNNYNNFSRDEWVFEVTVDIFYDLFKEYFEERQRFKQGMDHFYQLYIKESDKVRELLSEPQNIPSKPSKGER